MASRESAQAAVLESFGSRLRKARETAGMSQEHLAHLAGLHRTYVGSVERGERNVALLNIIGLARALGLPARELFPPDDVQDH